MFNCANIWCEYGKDQLNTKGCRTHTRKNAVVAKTTNHSVLKIDWHLDLGPNNAWCEFQKDPLQLKGLEYTQEKIKLAPWWPQR